MMIHYRYHSPFSIPLVCFLLLVVHGIQQRTDGMTSSSTRQAKTTTSPAIIILQSTPTAALPSRRAWILQQMTLLLMGGGAFGTTLSEPCHASEELPSFMKDYTKLAPLGSQHPSETMVKKTTGLSLREIASRLSHDLVNGATGQGAYFLTGDLSTDLFRDDCVFQDPTNRVNSLSQYQSALRILFDPQSSTVELIEPLTIVEGGTQQGTEQSAPTKNTIITGRIRSRGNLQLPWKPYVTAYESTLIYTVDEDGLIARQEQTWSKDASKAFQESFTPSWVDPPPVSHQLTPPSEPQSVTRLFQIINGRRPYEYSAEERHEVNALINDIVVYEGGETDKFDRSLLPGTWILAYLQPGPNGAGIDRRIPFPELDFNDNFQIFGEDDSIVNVGQIWGPLAYVQVFGTLQEEDVGSTSIPKRFQATIQGGKVCAKDFCAGLPIEGTGLFDSLYLGQRLRIGQYLNGGGARVVQIRLDDGTSIR